MSRKPNESWWKWLLGRLRNRFLSGLLVVVPIAATILILAWLFNTIDGYFQPIIRQVVRWVTRDPSYSGHIIGLGFAITIALVLFSGIIAGNFVGRRVIAFGDSILKRIPLFKQIYGGAKQVVEGLSGTGSISKAAFREVVLVEFPSNRMTHIAFITNEFTSKDGRKLFAVYLPSTPVPWSGFSGIVTEDMITRTKITIDEALKMVISGVLIAPKSLEIADIGKFTATNVTQPVKEEEEPPKR
jgi:uncharacterized membrane protein